MSYNNFNELANKLIAIEDKFSEIEKIANMLNIWVKDNDYELIPIVNILNNKINDIAGIIKNN